MLNDTIIRSFKAKEKPYKKTDSAGLYLYITPKGKKVFRIDFTFEKKRKTYTIGEYPIVSLAEARKILYECKIKLKEGIDPTVEKQSIKRVLKEEKENTFQAVAIAWIDIKQSDKTPKHKKDVCSKLERFIYPTMKERNIGSITSKEMLEVIRRIEAKGLYETAKKVLGICNQI